LELTIYRKYAASRQH